MSSQPQKSVLPQVFAGGIIVLAGWAVYSNSFHGVFFNFDDFDSIVDNLTIRHLWRLDTVLFPTSIGGTVSGRPILNLSFAVNYALDGTEVWGYHVTNVVIHLLNGLLLLGIFRRTFLLPILRPAFGQAALLLASAIALLWVVHPLQTESVTYTVQRAESLASLFYLLTLYAVIRGSQSGRPTTWYVVAVIACWLSVATKEIGATAPILVLLYDRTLLAGTFRQAWQKRWGLYLGLAVSWALLMGLIVQRGFVSIALRPDKPGAWNYIRSQPGVILHYLWQAVWPHPLSLNWSWPAAQTWSAICWPALLIGLLLAATIWGLRCSDHDSRRAWGLLGAWFFLTLAPSSSVMPLLALANEHRMYLPLVAVIALLVIGAYLVGKRWLVCGLVIPAAIVLGVLTFQRNQDYQDEVSMQRAEARRIPDHPAVHISFGNALLNAGQLLEAIEQYQEMLRLVPSHVEAHNNWGRALVSLGRSSDAIEHFEQALRLDPHYAEAHNYWGIALLMLGRPSEAIEHFKQALDLDPRYADAHNNWGIALTSLGRPSEAIEHFEQATRLKPDDINAHLNWGKALLSLGRFSDAIEPYKETLRRKPDDAEAHFNLAVALLKVGRLDEAIEHGRKLDTLAAAYASAGKFDEAIATAKEAWQLAQAAKQNSLAQEIFTRLQHYRDQKPYRDPAK